MIYNMDYKVVQIFGLINWINQRNK